MLNSFLSHLLFGTTSSNENSTTTQQQEDSSSLSNSTQSAINNTERKNDNEKYIDVRNDIDWVIVDPSDNEEVKKHLKRKLNSMVKSMQMSEYGLTSLFEQQQQESQKYANCGASDGATISDDSMDRSLSFDETRPMTPEPAVPVEIVEQQQQPIEKDSWLITPLPSLVSLQTSQKSIIENAPLENLLIEHPSMSVFITQDEVDESEKATEADSSFALIDKSENEVDKVEVKAAKKSRKKAKKQAQQKPQQQQAEVQAAVNNNNNNNKENEQQQRKVSAKTQICNKQTSNKLINSSQFCKDRCNYSKLQEKCKFYVKNVNLKQRKCHNLQQPQYLNVNFVNIRH